MDTQQEYRYLTSGEILQEGDELFCGVSNKWISTNRVGRKVKIAEYRRPIKQTPIMRQFRLLKDLPGIANGTISDQLERDKNNSLIVRFLNHKTDLFTYVAIDDKEWIEEITQITVTQLSFDDQWSVLCHNSRLSPSESVLVVSDLNDKGYQIVKI